MQTILSEYINFVEHQNSSILININDFLMQWTYIYKKTTCFSGTLTPLIEDVNILIDKTTNSYVSNFPNMDDVVVWFQDYLKDEQQHKEDGHNFNVFDLLSRYFDLGIKETIHSKLIKFLLDSDETHGQGDLFLIKFLELLEIESPQKGIWHISAETEDRIDILLQRSEPLSVVIIENKAKWASDQPNQLYRYWYNAIYLRTGEKDKQFYEREKASFKIIYLPPNSAKQYDEQSRTRPNNLDKKLPLKVPIEIETLTFDDFIQKWLETCKAALTPKNHRIREYIEQYELLCKTL